MNLTLSSILLIHRGDTIDKRPHLYWFPCASHCTDLMLENIGKIPLVKAAKTSCIFLNGYICGLLLSRI